MQLGPLSFYQVNTLAAERLYGIAAQYAQLTPDDLLLDLYCGMGTIGLSMVDYCRELVGVEIDYDLSKTNFGEYGEMNKAWSADDVKGFTKIYANPLKVYHYNQIKNGKEEDL